MTGRPGRGQLARKVGILTAVAATGFLCGWSALGMTDGVVLAIALVTARDPRRVLRQGWSRRPPSWLDEASPGKVRLSD